MTISNNWNTGSIVNEVANLFTTIPSAISGTALNNVIYGAITYVSNYVGVDLGSTAIDQKYHNAIIYKVMIDATRSSNINNNNADSTSIGDLSVNSVKSTEIVQTYSQLLKEELNVLGKKFSYYRTY